MWADDSKGVTYVSIATMTPSGQDKLKQLTDRI